MELKPTGLRISALPADPRLENEVERWLWWAITKEPEAMAKPPFRCDGLVQMMGDHATGRTCLAGFWCGNSMRAVISAHRSPDLLFELHQGNERSKACNASSPVRAVPAHAGGRDSRARPRCRCWACLSLKSI